MDEWKYWFKISSRKYLWNWLRPIQNFFRLWKFKNATKTIPAAFKVDSIPNVPSHLLLTMKTLMRWVLKIHQKIWIIIYKSILKDIEQLEGEDALGARSERPDMEEKIGAMNRMINTFRKFGRVNLSACEKLPIWNAKAEKLRQGLKKAINRSTRLRLKANKNSL